MSYRVIRPSTAGRRGQILSNIHPEHARQLIERGLIEPVADEKPKKKKASKKKGGKAEDANPKEKIERK